MKTIQQRKYPTVHVRISLRGMLLKPVTVKFYIIAFFSTFALSMSRPMHSNCSKTLRQKKTQCHKHQHLLALKKIESLFYRDSASVELLLMFHIQIQFQHNYAILIKNPQKNQEFKIIKWRQNQVDKIYSHTCLIHMQLSDHLLNIMFPSTCFQTHV